MKFYFTSLKLIIFFKNDYSCPWSQYAQMVFQLQVYLRMYIYIWEHEALKS